MIKDLQNNYTLRRLHSLSGIIPIGLFLIFHLTANSVSIFSAENYNMIINFLRSLPFVELVEWAVLFLPIIFHAVYGMIISSTAKPNQIQYSFADNWRYFLQRATGGIAMLYILYHVLQFRTVEHLDYTYIATSLASGEYISWLPKIPLLNPFSIYWFYVIGILAITWHFCNGIWSFCITWGVTVGSKSQQIVLISSMLLFVVLAALGIYTATDLANEGAKILAGSN
jgi:succinate dehydrogenase / fumarate reductase cytochrome b subunit